MKHTSSFKMLGNHFISWYLAMNILKYYLQPYENVHFLSRFAIQVESFDKGNDVATTRQLKYNKIIIEFITV